MTRTRRWTARTAPALLAFGGLWACTNTSQQGAPGTLDPTPYVGDHTERRDTGAPGVDEAGITARLVDSRLQVHVPLLASDFNPHAGIRVSARVVDGQDETVKAEGATMVGMTTSAVDLDLTSAEPLLGPQDGMGTLARYILVVEAQGGSGLTRVRRDLFASLNFLEVSILAPRSGGPQGTIRVSVLARDRSGTAAPQENVTVRVSGADPAAAQSFSANTNAQGHADVDAVLPADGSSSANVEVLVGPGGSLGRWGGTVAVEQSRQVLLTTDKPRYQPGQMMHLRALALSGADRSPYAGPLVFDVMDARGNVLFKQAATANAYGVASAAFRVGRRVNEGTWKARVGLGQDGRTAVVARALAVEKYVLPRFAVTVRGNVAQARPGENVHLDVTAAYTFGVGLAAGSAHIQASMAGQLVLDQVAALDSAGHAAFDVAAPSTGDGRAAPLNVSVEVTDPAGGTSTGTLAVTVVPDGLALQTWFATPVSLGGTNTLYVLLTDAVGTPAPGAVQVTSNGSTQVHQTNTDGLLVLPLTGLQNGAYIQLQAGSGNTQQHAYVSAPQAQDGLRVTASPPVVDAGQALAISVEAVPAAAGQAVVDVYASGTLGQSVVVDLDATGHGQAVLNAAPAGLIRLVARDLAGLKVGQANAYARQDRNLRVAVAASADQFRPRETAQVNLAVTNGEGVGVPAAVGVTVVDEAVFALADPSGPVKSFGEGDALEAPQGLTQAAALANGAEQTSRALLAFGANPGALHQIDLARSARQRAQNEARVMVQRDSDDIGRAAQDAGIEPWNSTSTALHDWLSAQQFLDPWGNAYRLQTQNSSWYERITSSGADELANTADDVEAYVYVGGSGGFADEDGVFAGGVAEPAPGGAQGGANTGGEPSNRSNGPSITVRREFPETLLVDPMVITTPDGTAQMDLALADNITTWRVSAVASDGQGRVGTGQGGVRVFQDFFLDLDAPLTLTEGDEVSITAVINNFLPDPQTVNLVANAGDWAELVSGAGQAVTVSGVSVTGTTVRIKALKVGEFPLTIQASNQTLQDAVTRIIRVKPSGEERPFTKSDRLEAQATVNVTIPANATPGGTELLVRVQPGVTSEVVTGLDSMLRMPSGCFEQTSSSNYPNVLVLAYLGRTGQSLPEVEARARTYLQEGYQRLTSYEVQGGGFSWFGDAPAHNVLTAYGLMQFVDMQEVFAVDAALIARTATWLASQQQSDGSFIPTQGGIAEGAIDAYQRDTFRTTAFLAWALQRAGGHANEVDRAVSWLRNNRADVTDSYALAVYVNLLAAVSPEHPDLSGAMGALLSGAHVDTDDVSFPGSTPSDLAPCGVTPTGQTDLEVTALAAQGLIHANGAPDSVNGALRHLVRNKDSFGTWQSTQATIRSLQAFLASLGDTQETAEGSLTVRLDGNVVGQFDVTPLTANLQRVVDLSELASPGQHVVQVDRVGTGNFQFQVAGRSYIPRQAPQAPVVSVSSSFSTTTPAVGEEVTVTAVIRTLAAFEQLMVEAPVPPGFDLDMEPLNALRTSGAINRAELQDGVLQVYAPALTPDAPLTLSWKIRPRLSAQVTAPPVAAYAYYDPAVRGESLPELLQVP